MKSIGIIGGGFSGTMVAVNLIKKATEPLELIIINEKETFNKGIAYNPYSKRQLLNVMASKMSAFADEPDHFLNWTLQRQEFKNYDKELFGNSFLPRYLYGLYLEDIWKNAEIEALEKGIKIRVIETSVLDFDVFPENVELLLGNEEKIMVDYCVIATGNAVPKNPEIINKKFYESKNYFQNPWKSETVENLDSTKPVLIIGNGLTMVDTVLGLLEKGFHNDIYSLSPNGFNILPHRHHGVKYNRLVEELHEDIRLADLVRLFNKHIKIIRHLGISAEPLIDSMRPFTQKIWRSLTIEEKQLFMAKLRHLWGVARHRIPLHIHDKLQQMRIDGKLHILSGKMKDITESKEGVKVTFHDKKSHLEKEIIVGRIINCTGPDTNIMNFEKSFLKNCLLKGIITQDELKLGINADVESFQVINAQHKNEPRVLTLGGNLKGMLWESTAVNEIRKQAENLAKILIENSAQTSNTILIDKEVKSKEVN